MLSFVKRLAYRDRVLEQLSTLLVMYPRGRQFADDFRTLPGIIRARFRGGRVARVMRRRAGRHDPRRAARPARCAGAVGGGGAPAERRSGPAQGAGGAADFRAPAGPCGPGSACRRHGRRRALPGAPDDGGGDARRARIRVPGRRDRSRPRQRRPRNALLSNEKQAGIAPRLPYSESSRIDQPPTQVSTVSGVQTSRPV